MSDILGSSKEKHMAQLQETLDCREVFECPSYSPGEGIRGERLGCSPWLLNGCLVALDHRGGDKNQIKSSGFSLSHVIHIV